MFLQRITAIMLVVLYLNSYKSARQPSIVGAFSSFRSQLRLCEQGQLFRPTAFQFLCGCQHCLCVVNSNKKCRTVSVSSWLLLLARRCGIIKHGLRDWNENLSLIERALFVIHNEFKKDWSFFGHLRHESNHYPGYVMWHLLRMFLGRDRESTEPERGSVSHYIRQSVQTGVFHSLRRREQRPADDIWRRNWAAQSQESFSRRQVRWRLIRVNLFLFVCLFVYTY